MTPRDRRWLILGIAGIACVVLLGYRALQPDPAAIVASPSRHPVSVERAALQLPGSGPAADTAPSGPGLVRYVGILRGRVMDAQTQKPIRAFELRLDPVSGNVVRSGRAESQTFQAADGRFEWKHAPAGIWMLTARARGYQQFELPDLEIASGGRTDDIVMPLRRGRTLRGRVYDEVSRKGIAEARIRFWESQQGRFGGNWRTREDVMSGKDGSFLIDGVPAGRLTVAVNANGYAAEEVDVLVGDALPPLQIPLGTGGTIAGRITAADGVTPVAASSALFVLDKDFGSSTSASESGEFSYPNLPAGRYRVTGNAQGRTATQEIVLARNERIEGIVLALGGGSSIRGVIAGLRPEELVGITVSAQRDGGLSDDLESVPVDDRGAYVMRSVPPGRVDLYTHVSGRGGLWKTVEVRAGADLTVNFEFPVGSRLSGRITRSGKPLARIRVRPRPVPTQAIFFESAVTSERGEYALENLAAGEYYLRAGDYRSRNVRVSGNTAFDVDIPAAQFTGRVLEGKGTVPLVGAAVEMLSMEPDLQHLHIDQRSDHFGQFVIDGLEPGGFLLTVYKPGYEMFRDRSHTARACLT